MAKKPKIPSAETIAQALTEVRERMRKDKELNDKLTKQFKLALAAEDRSYAGGYTLNKVSSWIVFDEALALPFAVERNAVKIDTSKMKKIFQLDTELRYQDPERYGFAVTDTERVDPISKNKAVE